MVRRTAHRVALVASTLTGLACLMTVGAVPTEASSPASMPTAAPLPAPDPIVGALFSGMTTPIHSCTASVVDSPTRNIVLTAAHCVAGTGQDLSFAPGYFDGQQSYGRWQVTAAYVEPSWITGRDPTHDYAFLTVAPLHNQNIEDVVGADSLAAAPASGQSVTVTGYVHGSGDPPISCTTKVYYHGVYPAFNCHGYYGGTSGSPFLVAHSPLRRVTGVIGGLQEGGEYEYTSYTSPFGPDTFALLGRAEQQGPGDTLGLRSQAVTFTSTPPVNAGIGGSYTATATGGGSGNPVVFSADPASAGICTVTAAGSVSFTGAGSCVIDADQAGNTTLYAPAPTLRQSIAVSPNLVAGLTAQAVTFTSTPPSAATVGGTYSATATGGGSGNPVVFSADPAAAGICTVAATGSVSFTGAGSCVIDADQAGNAGFAPAPTVGQTVTVNLVPQTLAFTSTPPAHAVIGGSYSAAATGGGSGNPVTYFTDPSAVGVCAVSSTGSVSFTAAGSCVIDATQAGNATYAAPKTAQQTVAVSRIPQTITFTSTPPVPGRVGTGYTATATGGNSANPVVFSADPLSAGCTVGSGGSVAFTTAGLCRIDANQSGSGSYAPAPQVQQRVTSKLVQTITFTSTPPSPARPGNGYTATATGGGSGNPVLFGATAKSSGCTVTSGGSVSFLAPGVCVVLATQAGDAAYTAATRTQTVTIRAAG